MFRLTLLSSLLGLSLGLSAAPAPDAPEPTAETRAPTQLTGPVLKALLTGHLYMRDKAYDKAYQAYDEAYRLQPSPTTAQRLWLLAVKTHNDKKVIQSVERWEATNPEPSETLSRAQLAGAIAARNPEKVAQAFKQLVEQMPEADFEFFEGALSLLEDQASFTSASQDAIRAALAKDDHLNALFVKGLLAREDANTSCHYFEEAVKRFDPKEELSDAINRAALVCWEAAPDRAKTLLEGYIKRYDGVLSTPDAELLLARALIRQNENEEGLALLKALEKRFPDTRMFLYNAATISMEAQDEAAAKHYLTKYLELTQEEDPDRYHADDAHRFLASIYKRAGNDAQAEKALSQLTQGQHAATAQKERIRLLSELQRHKEALALARDGMTRFPNDKDDFGLLALIWLPYASNANDFARDAVSIAESAQSAKVSYLVVDVLTSLHRTDLAQYVLEKTFPAEAEPRLKDLAKITFNIERNEGMAASQARLDELFAEQPMDADVLATYGKFLVKKNRAYEGIAFLHTSLKYQFNAFRALSLIEALQNSGRQGEANSLADQLIERTQVPLITHFARQAQGKTP